MSFNQIERERENPNFDDNSNNNNKAHTAMTSFRLSSDFNCKFCLF